VATGGYSQLYLHTNNAPGITGDGQALAFELDIPLKDMEFVQFYPTALGKLGSRILLYEVFVARAGAVLRNAKGEDILIKNDLKDPLLVKRDQLAQVIMHEIQEGLDVEGGVIMDLNPVYEKMAETQHLLPSLWSSGKREYIVSPTAHFCMGGIITNRDAETTISGLFVAGEACAGIHGANRLGGNALTEVFTMGCVAGGNAALRAKESDPPKIPVEEIAFEKARLNALSARTGLKPKRLHRMLKEVMWDRVGIVRQKTTLEKALERLKEIKSVSLKTSIENTGDLFRLLELHNMLLISMMVCRVAILRTESRP
jgi:succinate dehydrogenase/fumarate reductase flavoprotein subunit